MRTLSNSILICCSVVAAMSSVASAQESDLAVENTAPALADADTDVTFEVVVTNQGPDTADDVELSNAVPAGMTFVSTPALGCTTPASGAAGTITCDVAQLDSGEAATFSFVFHIDDDSAAGTFFTSVASASTATFDPNDENNAASATVQTPPPPSADVSVTKLGPSGTNPDTDVTYAIEVSNGGPGEATNVELSETLPGDMVFVSFTQNSGPPFGCGSLAGGVLTCSIATLGARASATFTLVGHIPLSTGDGTAYQNFATIASDYDPNAENDAATSRVCVQSDSCAAGPCNANVAVVCPTTDDQCQDQPTCDSVSGTCPPNPKADDTACDDGNACTETDSCQLGVCSGDDPVECPSASACETQGTCDPSSGECAPNAALADDTACDDGDECTEDDACASGVCEGEPSGDCDLDAGNTDESAPDASDGRDAAVTEADGAVPDSDTKDAATREDASKPDEGSAGKGVADAGAHDAGLDDAGSDAGDIGHADSDCSCRVGPGASASSPRAWWMLLALFGVARRFRHRSLRTRVPVGR